MSITDCFFMLHTPTNAWWFKFVSHARYNSGSQSSNIY
ncbi:hypothetical protein ApDm4_1564 [Acetobacter pomorum]|nr:hypothetical protein ApDm4_1564 [Acetobacter pomorum]